MKPVFKYSMDLIFVRCRGNLHPFGWGSLLPPDMVRALGVQRESVYHNGLIGRADRLWNPLSGTVRLIAPLSPPFIPTAMPARTI